MKKTIFVLIILLALCGCKSTVSVKSEYKDGYTMAQGIMPNVSDIVDADESATLTQDLVGNKIVVTALKNGKESVVEIPVEHEAIVVDGTTMIVDMSNYFSDPEMAKKASYSFEDELVVTCDDISFSVPYTVVYPSYTIADDITIDTYVGYDINDFVSADEGVEITSTLDEENSVLNITLTKNDWKVEESRTVTLVDSNPWPMRFEGYEVIENPMYKETLILYEDGTFNKQSEIGSSWYGVWEKTGENTAIQYGDGFYNTLEFNDDWTEMLSTNSLRRKGGGLIQTAYKRVN